MSQKSQQIKQKLAHELGQNAGEYWATLSEFINGRLTRHEFVELVAKYLQSPTLVQLHNALLLSLISSASSRAPATPPPDASRHHRKRKRQLPYQGPDPDDDGLLRSKRLKRWAVGLGKAERDKIKSVNQAAKDVKDTVDATSKPVKGRDEVMGERGVKMINEGKDMPGTHLPLHLAQVTRALTLQHIGERLTLISSQHGVSCQSRQVASLLHLGLESKIKSLITHAVTLTSSSRTITSIQPSQGSSSARLLTVDAFRTVFALAPHTLPGGSAAAAKLGILNEDLVESAPSSSGVMMLMGKAGQPTSIARHHDDPRWQLLSILNERSGIREALSS